ncbi:MAG TPA: adenylosuccinate lyase, partial [Clostridiaceae bacterium]|nr:adenylosuccinate lyase [Clostridiaceae bacterium]
TLDDSANKRISFAEAFLALDGVLDLYLNVSSNMVVYDKVITAHVNKELPFMATENIIMEAVKRGGDRQELHERIRVHSMEAGRMVKQEGLENDLIERIISDDFFQMTREEILKSIDPKKYVGRAPGQVIDFLETEVNPILKENADLLGENAEINV